MKIEMICKPMTVTTPAVGNILFTYDDITVTISVECEVSEAEVTFDNSKVVFDEIYIGLKDNKPLRVHNGY